MPIKSLGDYLKNYRKENHLKIIDLQKMTGISHPYLSQIESGKIPSKKTIDRLAKGMAHNEFIQSAIKAEMLNLAGYKAIADSPDEIFGEDLKKVKEGKAIQAYEKKIKDIEDELNHLKNHLDLNSILEKDFLITFDKKELSAKELKALKHFLLGIRALREND